MSSINPSTEVARAVSETRQALGALARAEKLAYPLMGFGPLIDRSTITTFTDDGESAFELIEETAEVRFRASVVRRIYEAAISLAAEIGITEADEITRLAQNAVNLFVLHELQHIRQNFPHFGSVQEIKDGMPIYGLPILDVAADTVAAWACANVEAQRLGLDGEEDILRHFVNMLMLAYVTGALVFDVVGRPEKMQRALGLLVAALLIQAKIDNLLNEDFIYKEWTPLSPLLAMNLASAQTFNVLVIDKVPGLLLKSGGSRTQGNLAELWQSIGMKPVSRTVELTAQALRAAGAIRTYAANEDAPLKVQTLDQSLKGVGVKSGTL